MSKQKDKGGYEKSSYEIEQERRELENHLGKYTSEIYNYLSLLDDEDVAEWSEYFRYFNRTPRRASGIDIDKDKLEIFIRLLTRFTDGYDVDKILSYLDSTEYGWHSDKYFINNQFLRNTIYSSKSHCLRIR